VTGGACRACADQVSDFRDRGPGYEAFAGELVALAEHDNGGHIVRFSSRDLGMIGRDRRFLRFAPPRARLRAAPEAAVTTEQ